MPEPADIAFLFDVDNTLLDNDRIIQDLSGYLQTEYGQFARDSYWAIFEEQRRDLGYADYLGALERYRIKYLHDPRILRMANWLIDYPFAERLYPGALDAVRHVGQWGTTAILSDGDAVFQPRKVSRCWPSTTAFVPPVSLCRTIVPRKYCASRSASLVSTIRSSKCSSSHENGR